jgi:hypothetical protein
MPENNKIFPATRSGSLRFTKTSDAFPKVSSTIHVYRAVSQSLLLHIKVRSVADYDGESMEQPLGAAQVPCLSPRRRSIDPAVMRAIESWISEFFARTQLIATAPLEMTAPLEITEWVSMDSRATPHALVISLSLAHKRHCIAIKKASETVMETDLVQALSAVFLVTEH